VTDYLADLYKTARFYFLWGFLVLFVVLTTKHFAGPPRDAEKAIKQLRGDPKLIELLRGPKGDPGERGPQGARGERGDRGEPAAGK
jgi:hypothetical protein